MASSSAPVDSFWPTAGVNIPKYNRRRDLAPAAQSRLLAVLFYAWVSHDLHNFWGFFPNT